VKSALPLLGIVLLGAALPALVQQTPEAKPATKEVSKPQVAQVMLDAALKKAKEQKKPVLVMFDASW
jgi:thiol:disulfide interchange protein